MTVLLLLCLPAVGTAIASQVSPRKGQFSVPVGQRDTNLKEKFESLWTDPRPISSLIRGGGRNGNDGGGGTPYCLSSAPFETLGCRFEVLLYPRGLLAGSSAAPSSGDRASAYLRYLPDAPGDEIDVAWTLRLTDGRGGTAIPVETSGGLPRSADTWSSAMTLCSAEEAVTGIGRSNDWGSSSWSSAQVCDALVGSELRIEGNVTLFEARRGEISLSWPLGMRGSVGAVRRAVAASKSPGGRLFRAGEIVVPSPGNEEEQILLERSGIFPGIEYRVMTLSEKDGNAIFSTESLSESERSSGRLALRPVSWKAQQQMWERRGIKVTDWPVEIEANTLSSNAMTRFNIESFLPRLASWIAADVTTALAFIALAITPIPLAFAARTVVSLYDIPSSSMEPTLMKGDVLLVEKFPGAFERSERGDIVLFQPPPALNDIIKSRGVVSKGPGIKNPFATQSLFVKRVVGLPGDREIVMDATTNEVMINGVRAVGPDRNMCDDEPLKLIDRLLDQGKGKYIAALGVDDVYVLGDCKEVSVDSRVFGTLNKDLIVGKPIARVFPPSRFSIDPRFEL